MNHKQSLELINAIAANIPSRDEAGLCKTLDRFSDIFGSAAVISAISEYYITFSTVSGNRSDEHIWTLPHIAIGTGMCEVMDKLLALGFYVNHALSYYNGNNLIQGYTPLVLAIDSDNIEMVNTILRYHPDFLMHSFQGASALEYCKSLKSYQLLISSFEKSYGQSDTLLLRKNKQGLPALLSPIIKGNSEILLHMIRGYFNVIIRYAAIHDLIDVVKTSLSNDYPENAHDYELACNILNKKHDAITSEVVAHFSSSYLEEPQLKTLQYWKNALGSDLKQGTVISTFKSSVADNQSQWVSVVRGPAFVAAEKNWVGTLAFLMENGYASMKDKQKCMVNDVGAYNNRTLLMIACQHNSFAAVDYLLSCATMEDLCSVIDRGANFLYFIHSNDMFDKAMDRASTLGCSKDLLKVMVDKTRNLLQTLLGDNRFDLSEHILNKYSKLISETHNVHAVLHQTRQMYWRAPQEQLKWSRLCTLIHSLYPEQCKYDAKILNAEGVSASISEYTGRNVPDDMRSYKELFGKTDDDILSLFSNRSLTKEEALERCIAEIGTYFIIRPVDCIPLLAHISTELERYFLEKHGRAFPVLERETQMSFKALNRNYYPIPNSKDYKGIKKHSALQEYLSGLFQENGFGRNATKWLGFIPENMANQHLRDCDFFTEERLGEGLIHGKMTHMIHWAMILIMVQQSRLSLNYNEEGQTKQLTSKEIISSFVVKSCSDTQLVWTKLLDSAGRPTQFNFPHALSSFIMHQGIKHDMRALSDSITDTFCKGFLELLRVHNTHLKQNQDTGYLHSILSDQKLRLFSLSLVLLPYAREREQFKGTIASTAPVTNYYIAKRKYSVNKTFMFNAASTAKRTSAKI